MRTEVILTPDEYEALKAKADPLAELKAEINLWRAITKLFETRIGKTIGHDTVGNFKNHIQVLEGRLKQEEADKAKSEAE